VCARNRKIEQSRWAAVCGAGKWVAGRVRSGILALGIRGGALVALAACSLGGMYLAEYRVGRQRDHRVYPSRFRAQGPAWCAADLAKVAFPRESYSIFDPALTREVAEAYAASCWVAAVRRVEKALPNKLIVDLDLREPAALIRHRARYRAISATGIYLPLDDRLWDHQKRPLPVIYGVAAGPPKPGETWDDPYVCAGVAVLRALAVEPSVYQKVGMVDVSNLEGKKNARDSRINLYTRRWGNRVVIRWGTPPDQKSMEPPPREKLAALRQRLARPIDLVGGAAYIDLRFPAAGTLARRH